MPGIPVERSSTSVPLSEDVEATFNYWGEAPISLKTNMKIRVNI
jgi:hypothetical protein